MASTEEQEAAVGSFIAITGTERERAVFFLQSAAWNLDAAVGTFYDDSSSDHSSSTAVQESSSYSQIEPTPAPTPPPSSAASNTSSKSQARGGVATLSDYKGKPKPNSGEDAQQFYAGGSEHSGQMIEGPPKKKPDAESIAKQVFEAAKKHGAVSVEEEEEEREKERRAAFHGAGFRLGDAEGPSVPIGNQRPLPAKPDTVRHVLTFWRDGFSVDDGPLRTGDTPEDKAFIDGVRRGEIPQELRSEGHGREVDVDIRDRRDEAYVKPKPKIVAFSGAGRKLGSYAPEVKSSSPSSPSSTGASSASSSSSSSSSAPPPPSVPLDPDLPTTSLQIRLADGTRLVAKFNHTHTVNDVRQFINMSRPSSAHYILMTTFPNKELSDPTLTLSEAQLLNAVIVQRIR